MNKPVLWIAVLCACLWIAAPATSESASAVTATASGAGLDEASCVNCSLCTNQPDFHKTSDVVTGGSHRNGHPEICRENPGDGEICDGHPKCSSGTQFPEGDDPIAAVLSALSVSDFARIESLRDQYPNTVSLHAQRSAIQILGCDGTLIAHIPLSMQQLTALELAD